MNSGFTVRVVTAWSSRSAFLLVSLIAHHLRVPFARGPDAVAAGVTQLGESNASATPGLSAGRHARVVTGFGRYRPKLLLVRCG